MAKQLGVTGVVEPQSSSPQDKSYLAFSIDSILGRGQEKKILAEQRIAQRDQALEEKAFPVAMMDSQKFTNLPWLSYTRYFPPKLPSKYPSN